VIDRVITDSFADQRGDDSRGAVQRRVATTVALALARVQRDPALSPTLAPALDQRLRRLAAMLQKREGNEAEQDWARGLARLLADREALDKVLADPKRAPQIPPGMPIGSAEDEWLAE
jgi:hypothetical protein